MPDLAMDLAGGSGSGGSAAVVSERWALPAIPNPDDEEFNSSSLSNFVLYDAAGAVVAGQPADATIDPYTDDTVNHHIDANTKRSWLRWKCRRNNARFYYLKLHTPDVDERIWARVGTRTEAIAGIANDEVDVGLVLMAQSAGLPDINNRIELLWIQIAAQGRKLVARSVVAGVATDIYNPVAANVGADLPGPLYLHMHKLDDDIHYWTSHEGSGLMWNGGPATNASAFVYAGFMAICNGVGPGNGWLEADFLRFEKTATFIP